MEPLALFSIITLAVVAGNLISLVVCGFYFQKVFKTIEANVDITAQGGNSES